MPPRSPNYTPLPPGVDPVQFNHYGKARIPDYVPLTPERAVDPERAAVIPDVPDTNLDIQAVLSSGPIPEIRPVFLGLRAAMARRRIVETQEQIERLAPRQAVVSHLGKSVLTGAGYHGQDDPLRPVAPEELSLGNRLQGNEARRRRKQAEATNILNAYPFIGDPRIPRPSRLSAKEEAAITKATARYRLLTQGSPVLRHIPGLRGIVKGTEQHDRKHARLVRSPAQGVSSLVEERDGLVRKLEGIEAEREQQEERRRNAAAQR